MGKLAQVDMHVHEGSERPLINHAKETFLVWTALRQEAFYCLFDRHNDCFYSEEQPDVRLVALYWARIPWLNSVELTFKQWERHDA